MDDEKKKEQETICKTMRRNDTTHVYQVQLRLSTLTRKKKTKSLIRIHRAPSASQQHDARTNQSFYIVFLLALTVMMLMRPR